MDTRFRLLPEQASAAAVKVDHLYFFLVAVSLFFGLLICALIVYFAIKYRRNSQADRRQPGPAPVSLEIAWTVIPLFISMIMFGWGAKIYIEDRRPPPDAMEINVVGKQWMWKLQHPEGNSEINELHVPLGQNVRLRMTSEDVIHSFFIPAFRIKMDVVPSRYTFIWFKPTRVGEYHLFCAEYCGTEHSFMRGRVIVQSPSDYAQWLSGTRTGEPMEVTGRKLFEQFRCDSCHHSQQGPRCPPLGGLLGQHVELRDGRTIEADEDYIRESIVDPAAKVVAGYEPLMPSYKSQISEEGILQIIAYIKSLGGGAPDRANP